jgi:hypothetical protein
MSEPPKESSKIDRKSHAETRHLCAWMGLTLITWQAVEDAHYLLFFKLLGTPRPEICSVVYFSPPTFESRRVMTDRIAQITILEGDQKKEWKELNKKLEAAAAQRGKIAHYALDFEIKITGPGPDDFERGEPRLSRSKYNRITKSKADEEHHVTVAELRTYTDNFDALAKALDNFTEQVKVFLPQQGLNLLLGLSPFLGKESTAHLSLPTPSPSDDEPSGQ